MKSIAELQHETNIEALTNEIRIRRKLISEMVGNLYPNIVEAEIETIDNMIYRIRAHEPKQVIVMRKDLNMRKGKMVAQGSHASLGVILYMMNEEELTMFDGYTPMTRYTMDANGYVRQWLKEKFTKVCVSVNSEQELLDVYQKAKDEGLPAVLITDSGLTEFGGVPTNTCCGIGPWRRDEIDKITGHLSLL